METWKAFNLDTVLSIWLTGAGDYGWLRRHVRPAARLDRRRRLRAQRLHLGALGSHQHDQRPRQRAFRDLGAGMVVGDQAAGGAWSLAAFALACQVFAGHLQDVSVHIGARWPVRGFPLADLKLARRRRCALGMAAGLCRDGRPALGRPVDSLERAARPFASRMGLPEDLTYASWHPELFPTLVVREAYGTRARDTDWMNGFYPYHEMERLPRAAGSGARGDRGRGAGSARSLDGSGSCCRPGACLMLGKFIFLFDYAHRIPMLGSSREPVRFHLWVSLAVAALAAVGIDRLGRPGSVPHAPGVICRRTDRSRSRSCYIYSPGVEAAGHVDSPVHLAPYRWLGRELEDSPSRTAILVLGLAPPGGQAGRATPVGRQWLAGFFRSCPGGPARRTPSEVPTVSPATGPHRRNRPKAQGRPELIRVFGIATSIPASRVMPPSRSISCRARYTGLEPAGGLGPGVVERRDADDRQPPARLSIT